MSTASAAGGAAPPQPSPPLPPNKPLINLLRGWPAPSLLPVAQLRAAADRVLSGADPAATVASLQYGPDPGYQPLREQLAHYLSAVFQEHGAPHDPARICITGGASQNVACVLQSFTDPTYTAHIWVSAPCYYLMCPIFEDAGFARRLRAVPEDDEGIDVTALERGFRAVDPDEPAHPGAQPLKLKPNLPPHRKAYRHVVYVVPASSNPSGRTMSLARRQALVRLARRYDALVVADDVYDFLQWEVDGGHGEGPVALPPSLPRLVDIDRVLLEEDAKGEGAKADGASPPRRFGNAISNGSFSKIVGPGMRTGWVEAAPDFAFGLAQTGSTKSGGAPSQLCASMIAELMRTGELDRHLRDVVRPGLRRRHRLLTEAIEAHRLGGLAEVKVRPSSSSFSDSPTYGGYFLWLRLRRAGLRATDLAARAQADENLVIAPGTMFEVKGDEAAAPFDDHLRLCFSYEDEEKLVEGVERLARVLRSWDDKPQREQQAGAPDIKDDEEDVISGYK